MNNINKFVQKYLIRVDTCIINIIYKRIHDFTIFFLLTQNKRNFFFFVVKNISFDRFNLKL